MARKTTDWTPVERAHMARALRLAQRARGRTAPNPMVGCVVVDRRGRVIAEGWHHEAGLAHAEVDALRKLPSGKARGATVFVTLEPCNHTGRTGPCTEALLAAGVGRVVAAMQDPHDIVAGQGLERLRGAGVDVAVGLLEEEARALNGGYLHWLSTGRPRVTLKAAVTLDGRMAAATGDARWVTGEAARREAHRLRDASEAILVGVGTVLADDPELTTRLGRRRSPDALRVVLDGSLRTPATAKLAGPNTLVVCGEDAPARREAALVARGVEVLRLAANSSTGRGGKRAPSAKKGEAGRVPLAPLLDELGRRGVHDLLVEGGGRVHGAFLAAGLAQRLVVFVAPKLVGAGGPPLVDVPGVPRMADAWRLARVSTRRLGDDMMIAGFLDAGDPPRT